MTKRYKDFYGATASIKETAEGAKLVVKDGHGKTMKKSTHKNFAAARSAMQRVGEGWRERK